MMAAALMGAGGASRAQDPASSDRGILLVPYPKMLKPPVAWPLEGAERTVWTPATIIDGDLQPITEAAWTASGLDAAAVQKQTGAAAAALLAKLKPELVRNSRKVIEYAVFQTTNAQTCTLPLAPGFAKQFEAIFGPKFRVAIPNCYTVYIFPQLAADAGDFGPLVLDGFSDSAHPISNELFEMNAGQLHVIGGWDAR